MDAPVVNSELTIWIASKSEDMAFLWNEAAMLRATWYFCNNHFEAETLRDVEWSLEILLIHSVTKLAPVVITPREELSVTSLFLFFVVYSNLKRRSLGCDFIQTLTFHKLARGLSTVWITALIFTISTRENAHLIVSSLILSVSAIVPIRWLA